jgi:hypothetical protein
LRFFQGTAELFSSADLIGRLTGMVEELEAKAERAEANAEESAVQAAQATAKAAQATAEVERAAAKVDRAIVGMRETVLAVLSARGIACPDDARARLTACEDLPTLQRWVARATVAASAAEALSPASEGP